MKTIACWANLAPYGVTVTGHEDCPLSYRLRARLDDRGRALLSSALGLETCRESALLTAEMLRPLAVYALLGDGCANVVEVEGKCFHGFDRSEYSPSFTGALAEGTALRIYWTCKERTGVLFFAASCRGGEE